MPIKIYSLCDTRIGATYEGVDKDSYAALQKLFKTNYRALLDKLVSEGYRFVVFSGNIFDDRYVSEQSVQFFIDECELHKKLEFILAPGESDIGYFPVFFNTRRIPQNVHIFTSIKPTRFDFEDISFYGFCQAITDDIRVYSLGNLRSLKPVNDSKAHVLVAPLQKPMEEDIRDAKYFGAHVSLFNTCNNCGMQVYEKAPLVLSPGTYEPREFGKKDFGGGVSISVDILSPSNINVNASYETIPSKRYHEDSISVDNCETEADITQAITNFLLKKHYGNEDIVNLTITGSVPLFFKEVSYNERLSIFALHIFDATVPTKEDAKYGREMSVIGEVYRAFRSELKKPDSDDRRLVVKALRHSLESLQNKKS